MSGLFLNFARAMLLPFSFFDVDGVADFCVSLLLQFVVDDCTAAAAAAAAAEVDGKLPFPDVPTPDKYVENFPLLTVERPYCCC